MLLLTAFASASVLSFAVISPALAKTQQDMTTQANCAKLQYPTNQEPGIITDTETGVVSIDYIDASGVETQTQLNFKKDNLAGCSEQGKRILTDVRLYQAKYNADMCDEMTSIVEGKKSMPILDGRQPTMDHAKAFQKEICTLAAEK